MTVLRVGLLAASAIAEGAVVEPASAIHDVEITAVAARSADRAAQAAERWGIPRWFGGYREMLDDGEIDAVYVSTPPALHRPWAVAALEAGKHVLCEKPFASNASDAAAMAQAAQASGLVLMEALHWRYHPLVAQMRSVLDAGVLGAITHVEASLLVAAGNIPRTDIRWDLSLGGGSMMDIGVYPATWVRWLMGADPAVIEAHAQCPVPGVDGLMRVQVAWESGTTGSIESSMIWEGPGFDARLTVTGHLGEMVVENPMAPQLGSSLTVRGEAGVQHFDVASDSTYDHQLRAFRDAVLHAIPMPTTAGDAVLTMKLLDSCYLAAGLEPRPSVG